VRYLKLYSRCLGAEEAAMATGTNSSGFAMTPEHFISEVREFRAFVASLVSSPDEKERAYKLLVKHAAMLDPHAVGYEGAGVALKEACSTWLDCKSERELSAAEEA
jgi:hypothetical protein